MWPSALPFKICLAIVGSLASDGIGEELFQPFGYLRNGAFDQSSSVEGSYASLTSQFAAQNALGGTYSRSNSPHTVFGPVHYIGNTGAEFTDFDVVGIGFSGGRGTVNTDVASALSNQLLTDVNGGTMTVFQAASVTNLISNSIDTLAEDVGGAGDSNTHAAFAAVTAAISTLQSSMIGAGSDPVAAGDKTRINNQITALNTTLAALDANLAGLALSGSGGVNNVTAEERLADDINGNGNNGFQRVVSLVDGELVTIGTIIDFGDLHEFNVFFDTVVVSEAQAFTSFEVMKQHVFYASPGENRLATGWRFDAYWDDWSAGFGEEVRGGWAIDPERLDSINHDWLRDSLAATTWSTYGTVGVRAMRLEDDFSFDGRGSILGRTRVATMIDHDVIGPQLGWGVVAEASMFRFEAVLLGLLGYGNAETKQTGIFGEELIPSALNRPSTGRTTNSDSKLDDDYLAWHGETRITGSCQLTQHLRFEAMWRGILTGPIRSASASTAWNAPDFGIHDLSGDTIDASHWFFGLTYTH